MYKKQTYTKLKKKRLKLQLKIASKNRPGLS